MTELECQIIDVLDRYFDSQNLTPDEQVRLTEILQSEFLVNPKPFLKGQLHNCERKMQGFWFSTLREYEQIGNVRRVK